MSVYRSSRTGSGRGARVGSVGLLLFEAAKQGSLENLEFALGLPGAKDHVNYSDRFGQTPLIVAAQNGHLACVKLLLCHGADMLRTTSRSGQELTICNVSANNGHRRISEYIQGCIDDLIKFNTTRAHMEADVINIASSPTLTPADVKEFTTLLTQLIEHCGYDPNGGEEDIPLLIRAARMDNISIVHRLVTQFKVTLFANDPDTGESVLHVACHNKSKLRYCIVEKCPDLLRMPDNEGRLPLHIACAQRDIEFVSWLFKCILDKTDSDFYDEITQAIGSIRPRTSSLPQLPSSQSKTSFSGITHQMSLQPASYRPPRRSTLKRMEEVGSIDGESLEVPIEESGSPNSNSEKGLLFRSYSIASSTHSTMQDSMEVDDIDFDEPLSKSPLVVSDVVDLRFFRVSMKGESILHILAREGFTDLLALVLKVAKFIEHNIVDLDVLTRHDGARTPVEEAISCQNPECLRLLLHFSTTTGTIDDLLANDKLIKNAVFTGNVEVVKVLIEFGFHNGLGPAISLAFLDKHFDILRLLLYYHTQVINLTERSRIRKNHSVTVDTGGIKLEGFQLEEVRAIWIYDSYDAVESVIRTLNMSTVLDTSEKNHLLYCQLGQDCLEYFNKCTSPSLSSQLFAPITEVNLSENQLSFIPPEIFQMPSLQILNLSYNHIQELPSSEDPLESIYTATQLKHLDLDSNELRKLPEDMFQGLAQNLEDLSVNQNKLQDLPPGIWIMPKLKRLRLGRNCLSRLHYLSSPRYFDDQEFTSKVVSVFTVSEGSLRRRSHAATDEDFESVDKYVKKLGMFVRLLHVVQCEAVDQCGTNFLKEVLDTHWLRIQHYGIPAQSNDENVAEGSVTGHQEILATEEEEEECVPSHSKLTFLDLSDNDFSEVPWDLPCVAPNLQRLDLRRNSITDLDIVRGMPVGISTLMLDENKIANVLNNRPASLPCGNPVLLLSVQLDHTPHLYCEHCRQVHLENLSNLTLAKNCLEKFPVVDVVDQCLPEDPEQPGLTFSNISYQPFFPNLSILSLEHNHLKSAPQYLHHLTHLSSLILSHNSIHELPLEMGLMNTQSLLVLKLEGMFLHNIPPDLLAKPMPKYMLNFLKSIKQKSKPYRRIKLMTVGAANQGKTSLLINLTKKGKMTRFKEVEFGYNNHPLSTVGVDLGDWEYAPGKKPKVTFMTWDFGGQEEYYATHQFFLTNRSLYLLVWSVKDGVMGLRSLKPWLENIEGRAPSSPVIVVGTHIDSVPSGKRSETLASLRTQFRKLYVEYNANTFAYPCIEPYCVFVNCYDARHMDWLRDHIYNFVVQYKPPGPRHLMAEMAPLLEQPIPASYIKLQDIVRNLAQQCSQEGRIPIYSKKDYINALHDADFLGKVEEMEQATSFLHNNGIMLHFDDALLSDLYFVNPQWLCSLMANVITVQEKNPFQKNGFMVMEALKKIFQSTSTHCVNCDLVTEFLTLMQNFEVILMLDRQRILIPSLLPTDEQDSCIVFPKSVSLEETETSYCFEELSKTPHAPICQVPHPLLVRYYLLPFVPNGFFPRLIARLMSSNIMDHMLKSLVAGPLESHHILNVAHWQCWRNGIVLIWNHLEIFRIAPFHFPLPGTTSTVVISNSGKDPVETPNGIEVKVAVLPEDCIANCGVVPNREEVPNKGQCLATWLLHQASDLVDSVFEDWYESFARKKGFEYSVTRTANPCTMCFKNVKQAESASIMTPAMRRFTFSFSIAGFEVVSKRATQSVLYTFSTAYCAMVQAQGEKLVCPLHGELTVAEVAPDLVFSDFPPSMVFTDPGVVGIKQALGDGGFGTVYHGTLCVAGETQNVAVKQFRSQMGFAEQDPLMAAEITAWDIYQSASIEGRMMFQLDHPHILSLLGLTFQPIRLVLELAPLGDLKGSIKKFQRARVRLSRRTLKHTMIQIAEALEYMHSKKVIYRDLKPGNVLVWKFPLPETQWNPEATVCIKIADYGISKQISPQGIRGLQGTPPYLPPEVMLHGGKEAYSNKLDVWSFGMFMYFLFSYLNPFENDPRPITALLEEGKRPELPLKHHPTSLQMFELMCWCWSEKPQCRPNFQEILEVVRTDTFNYLLAANPISKSNDEVRAACIRTTKAASRKRSTSSNHGKSPSNSSLSQECSFPSSGVMSLLHCTTLGEETAVEVWYGTEKGSLGLVQYQQSGTVIEQFEPPVRRKFVSSMCVACSNIWIGTVGAGLWVFDPTSKQPVAMWGDVEKQTIYKLLHVEDTNSILVLTRKGMYSFSSLTQVDDPAVPTAYEILTPTHSYARCGNDINEGVVIPADGNLDRSEVWVCAQTGPGFQILHPATFSVLEEVLVPNDRDHKGMKIRHISPFLLEGQSALAVANGHFVQRWDVKGREKKDDFDCHELCKDIYGDHVRSSRVTSLLADTAVMYVGTEGGAILVLDSSSMEVSHILHAYNNPVRCLLSVSPGTQVKPFMRMFSRKESGGSITPTALRRSSGDSSSSLISKLHHKTSTASIDEAITQDRSLLLSFGMGYRGIVGQSPNHPQVFILPSESAVTSSGMLTSVGRVAKPSAAVGHLLLWSAETVPTTTKSLPCFDELEEDQVF